MLLGYFRIQNKTFIKRLMVSGDVQAQLSAIFLKQKREFFFDGGEENPVKPFYPGDPSSSTVISWIEYDDPEGFLKAASSPMSYSASDPEKDLQYLEAVFIANPENPTQVLVQLIERRRVMLPKSGWLAFKKFGEEGVKSAFDTMSDSNCSGTFVEMEELGLQLDNKLTAVYDGEKLLFKSYFQANRIFDLGGYLSETTNDTVKEFLQLDCISAGENIATTLELFTPSQRRRVAQVMALGFVKKYSATEIVRRALRAKKNILIETENGKIKIPEKASDRATLLQFLANGIMASYLDDENDYEVGAMRPVT